MTQASGALVQSNIIKGNTTCPLCKSAATEHADLFVDGLMVGRVYRHDPKDACASFLRAFAVSLPLGFPLRP